MKTFKNVILPILITGIWINISETVRWVLIIENYWIEKYDSLNLAFPNETTNMIIWMVWGFLFATSIFILSKKFSVFQTTLLSWMMAFVMMWIVVWNVGVLPLEMLWINIPLSLLEAFIGAIICIKYLKNKNAST